MNLFFLGKTKSISLIFIAYKYNKIPYTRKQNCLGFVALNYFYFFWSYSTTRTCRIVNIFQHKSVYRFLFLLNHFYFLQYLTFFSSTTSSMLLWILKSFEFSSDIGTKERFIYKGHFILSIIKTIMNFIPPFYHKRFNTKS